MADRTYSVWALAPPDNPGMKGAAKQLQQVYGGPEVEAHVTVLGAFSLPKDEAVAKLQDLASSLPPITYRITGVDHESNYYKSVYLTVASTPEVMEANARTRRAFEQRSTTGAELVPGYVPHLSPLYGDLKDEDRWSAKATAEENYGKVLTNSEFVVKQLSLYETDPADKMLKYWRKVAEFPLEGRK